LIEVELESLLIEDFDDVDEPLENVLKRVGSADCERFGVTYPAFITLPVGTLLFLLVCDGTNADVEVGLFGDLGSSSTIDVIRGVVELIIIILLKLYLLL
jgi:hypothetical protein